MLAKTFTVSFALAAVLALLVLAEENFDVDCNVYNRCLELVETSPDTSIEANTIEAIRNMEDCETDVRIAVALESKCKLSRLDKTFGDQIAHYVEKCGKKDYWDRFIGNLREKYPTYDLKPAFPDFILQHYKTRLCNDLNGEEDQEDPEYDLSDEGKRNLYSDLSDDRILQMVLMNADGAIGNNNKEFDTELFKPCYKFVEDYKHTMVWIRHAATVVVDDCNAYLEALSYVTQKEFLQFELCSSVLDDHRKFNNA